MAGACFRLSLLLCVISGAAAFLDVAGRVVVFFVAAAFVFFSCVISGAAAFLDVAGRVVVFFVAAAFVFFSFAAITVLLVRELSLGLVAYTLAEQRHDTASLRSAVLADGYLGDVLLRNPVALRVQCGA